MVDLTEVTELYIPPPIDDVPDNEEDQPIPGVTVSAVGTQQLPYIIYGTGTFASQYNEDSFLNSDAPLRSVRLALRLPRLEGTQDLTEEHLITTQQR